MGLNSLMSIIILFLSIFKYCNAQSKVFNIIQFGAKPDGITDNSKVKNFIFNIKLNML